VAAWKSRILAPGVVGRNYSDSTFVDPNIRSWTMIDPSKGPPGLALQANGALSGTPTQAASYVFAVRGTDNTGTQVDQQVTLVIKPALASVFTQNALLIGCAILLVVGILAIKLNWFGLFDPMHPERLWLWALILAGLATMCAILPVALWSGATTADPSKQTSVPVLGSLLPGLATLVEGADGRASTSKFQLALWTGVVLFAFLSIFFTRWLVQENPVIPDYLPPALFAAMGLSAGTAVLAKWITSAQVDSGQVAKTPTSATPSGAAAPNPGAGALVQDDGGSLDQYKVQFLAWTFVGIGLYLFSIVDVVRHAVPAALAPGGLVPAAVEKSNLVSLPDLGAALAGLIGIGHATYLGKKLVTSTGPSMGGVDPQFGPPNTAITLSGAGFGSAQGTGLIMLGDAPFEVVASKWSDTQIQFVLPEVPSGRPRWQDTTLNFKVAANGQTSDPAPFALVLPRLFSIKPIHGPSDSPVHVSGANLGLAQGDRLVTLDGNPQDLAVTNWNPQGFDVKLPTGQTSNTTVNIGLRLADGASAPSAAPPFHVD
jgi:hypothetical protein